MHKFSDRHLFLLRCFGSWVSFEYVWADFLGWPYSVFFQSWIIFAKLIGCLMDGNSIIAEIQVVQLLQSRSPAQCVPEMYWDRWTFLSRECSTIWIYIATYMEASANSKHFVRKLLPAQVCWTMGWGQVWKSKARDSASGGITNGSSH